MTPNALAALFPLPWLAVALAVAGAVAGWGLTLVAARRTLAQPLALALTEEVTVLRGVLSEVRRLPYLTSLTAHDFAAGSHARLWQALLSNSPECAGLAEDAEEGEFAARGEALAARRSDFLSQVRGSLLAGPAPVGDVAALEQLLGDVLEPLDDAAVVDAGQAVLEAGMDRNRLSGAGLVLPTSTPDSTDVTRPPLHRVYVPPERGRRLVSSSLAAAAFALAPGLASSSGMTGAALVAATLSVLVLSVLSIVVSLVDLDTFYIDMPVFAAGSAVAWAGAAAAALLDGSPGRLLSGVGVIVVTALLFELGNRLHKLFRGHDGQGFGDTLILIATAGVPAALASSWTLGYYTIMAGMLLGVAGWVVGAARGRLTRSTPFAFGPYLSSGWVLAWAVVCSALFTGL